ncbi:MAG: saccharopine dehydrogenase NADP-binding domain-containing protein [Tessaracoccus sp.]|nr:saccharopine dehydrogenase NADP-binding domain-containing protein [Tessaracoccus sp.]
MTAAPRIVVLGATGYTGDLTARSLVRQGARPVLVGRNPARLAALAADLGGLDTATVDIEKPTTLRAVLHEGDILISAVGPFLKYGRTAVEAAAEIGVHYFDSAGEGPFIREVFERWGRWRSATEPVWSPRSATTTVPVLTPPPRRSTKRAMRRQPSTSPTSRPASFPAEAARPPRSGSWSKGLRVS